MMACLNSRAALGKWHNFFSPFSDWCEMVGCFSCKVNRKVLVGMWLPPALGGGCDLFAKGPGSLQSVKTLQAGSTLPKQTIKVK